MRNTISVIIPIYNEEGTIGRTLQRLKSMPDSNAISEIIVVDAGSTDGSISEARAHGATAIQSPRKGRAAQMNFGARAAKGSILYFLHADSIPPETFATDIREAVEQGFEAGCFRLRFDKNHWFLKANSWFTRFDLNAFRFGDQSLFVTAIPFDEVGGFCERHVLMEDQEIIGRLKKRVKFTVLPKEVSTSARKYTANGIFRLQGIFYLIYFMYQLGFSQETLVKTFRSLVRQDKI